MTLRETILDCIGSKIVEGTKEGLNKYFYNISGEQSVSIGMKETGEILLEILFPHFGAYVPKTEVKVVSPETLSAEDSLLNSLVFCGITTGQI